MKLLTFEDFPKDIADSLRRADAWQKLDEGTDTLIIISRNVCEPLTNAEKIRISRYLIMIKHLYKKVSFKEVVYCDQRCLPDCFWSLYK